MNTRLTLLPVLLVTFSVFCPINASIVEGELNDQFQQIVVADAHSVPLTFINDDTYPWTYTDNSIKTPTLGKNVSTVLSVAYSSMYNTEVLISLYQSSATYSELTVSVDGVQKNYISKVNGAISYRFYAAAGSHVLSFKDYTLSNNNSNYIKINSINVHEILPLETVVLANSSMPLTFVNEGEYPWIIEDGFIQNSNYGFNNTASSFSTTFTIDKPSIFSYERSASGSSNNHRFYENRIEDLSNGTYYTWSYYWTSVSNFETRSLVLEPGTHTITFLDTAMNTGTLYSKIRNISLRENWTDVELAYPGTLGSEVLSILDVLTDVELLKIKGSLNSVDWSIIKQMTNLQGLDLSEANITEIPEKAFNALTKLAYITLPEGLETIGKYAFQNTVIRKIHIPASVTSITEYAFYQQTDLAVVTFAENAQLKSIGQRAFMGCTQLVAVRMPNSVTSVGSYAFSGCTNLATLILSNELTSLPTYMCENCYNLSEIHLPDKLNTVSSYCFDMLGSKTDTYNSKLRSIHFPASLRTIQTYAFRNFSKLDSIILPLQLSSLGSYAFTGCKGTKYIQLPSGLNGYFYNFSSCSSLVKINCPSATPPSISHDPFSSGNAKSNITLEVPSFALASYKLNSYWYQFGNIVAGADQDYWKITNDLILSDATPMTGSPSVNVDYGGRLSINGSEPFNMRLLMFHCSISSSSALVNNNPSITADSVVCNYWIDDANKWYFVTPLYDTKLSSISHGNGSQFIFRYYDAARRAANGTGSSWQNMTEDELHRGQGYILQSNSNSWLNFRDDLHEGQRIFAYEDVVIPLQTHAAEKTANESWNFIGNPYPCYYDIWYLDFYTPITVWTGSTYKAYSITDDNYALRPMQAFFVQKPSTLDKIIFRKQGRQVNSTISHGLSAPERKATGSERRIINLLISGEDAEIIDETRVVINPQASMEYEMTCDASKFMSIEPDVPQIYSLGEDGTRMSINERPLADGIIPIGCYVGSAGNYTIACDETDDVYLKDELTGQMHDFVYGAYTFTAEENGAISDRFYLHVKQQHNTPTAIHDQSSRPAIMSFNGGFAIDCTSTDAAVYTIDGRIVTLCEAGHGWARLFLPSGIYVIKAAGEVVKQIVE